MYIASPVISGGNDATASRHSPQNLCPGCVNERNVLEKRITGHLKQSPAFRPCRPWHKCMYSLPGCKMTTPLFRKSRNGGETRRHSSFRGEGGFFFVVHILLACLHGLRRLQRRYSGPKPFVGVAWTWRCSTRKTGCTLTLITSGTYLGSYQ
jgi:hypothetical protein